MSAWTDALVSGLMDVVLAAWPETADSAMRESTAAMVNWRDEFKRFRESDGVAGIPLPMAILVVGAAREAGFGDANDAMEFVVEAYFVDAYDSGTTRRTAKEMDQLLADRCDAMRSALRGTVSGFQVIGVPLVDVSMTSEVNKYLAANGFDLKAGRVTFTALAGVSSEV